MSHFSDPGPLHDHPSWFWRVVIVCAPLALAFGTVGFWELDGGPPGATVWLDALYHAGQLLILHMPHTEGQIPWTLEIGRWLAAVSFVMTAGLTVSRIMGREALHISLRFMDDHVVICGLEVRALRAAGDYRAEGASGRVLVVAPDPTPADIAACRAKGATVIAGDPSDPDTLERVKVHKARALVAMCSDDNTNVEIATHARSLVERHAPGRTRALTCYVQLADMDLRSALQGLGSNPAAGGIDLRFFDAFDATASRLLAPSGPLPVARSGLQSGDPRRVHLVILGFGRLGRRLAVRAAQLGHFANGTRIRLTVVDRQARRLEQALLFRYPNFARACSVDFHQLEMESASALALLHAACEDPASLTSIAVCFDRDSLAAEVAARLKPTLHEHGVTIAVRMSCDAGLASLLANAGPGSVQPRRVQVFSMLDGVGGTLTLNEELTEGLAQVIHESFRDKRITDGRDPAHPSVARWPVLREDLKDSNRQQAAHLAVKLNGIGCEVASSDDPRPGVGRFESSDVEVMARMEHERWLAERWLSGWTDGPEDSGRKRSPYLVAWDQVPGDVQEYDREAVRLIPALLRGVDKKVCRVAAGH